jgi:hypothetical protein
MPDEKASIFDFADSRRFSLIYKVYRNDVVVANDCHQRVSPYK